MKNFQNRVAVITGGASGFGREFANIGARLGLKLVLADVQQDALDKAKAELESQGAQVLAMRCDVRKAEEVQALADATMAKFGAVHLVFNNAGVGTGPPNVPQVPKPTSSSKTKTMFGAPAGACVVGIAVGFDSGIVAPISPAYGGVA